MIGVIKTKKFAMRKSEAGSEARLLIGAMKTMKNLS